MNKGNYYTVIPYEVVKDPTLHPVAFKLYALISLYSSKEGYCWASNTHFAAYLNKSPDFISKMINILKKRRYIFPLIDEENGNKRYILLADVALKVADAIKNKQTDKFNPRLILLFQRLTIDGTDYSTYSSSELQPIIINNNTNKVIKESAKNRSANTFEDNSFEILLSQLLLKLIRDRKPDFKPNFSKAQLQRWAVDINRMINIDKRNVEQIEIVIIKCQEDSFWCNVVLSIAKLRIQFDQLELKLCGDLFKTTIKLNDETNKRLSNDIATWFCKKVNMNRHNITRNDADFNKIIQCANNIDELSNKFNIKLENILKYFKQCVISEYINNNKTVYLGTLCSDTLLKIVFPQYLHKVLPSMRIKKD